MTLSPNGKLVYVVDSSASGPGEPAGITPVDAATDKAGPEIKLPQSSTPFPVSGLMFSPDSATAYAITPSGIVPVNTATHVAGKPIGLRTAMPVAMAVTPDGSTLAEVGTPITAREPGSPYANNVTLALLSTATGTVRKVVTLGDEPGAVAWKVVISPNGSTAYVLVTTQSPSQSPLVSSQSTVIAVDLATAKAAKPLDVGQGAQTLAMSPNGGTVYVLVTGPYHNSSPHYGPGSVVPIATATGTLGKPVPVGELPQALAISQPPLDQVQDLVATSTIKSQLGLPSRWLALEGHPGGRDRGTGALRLRPDDPGLLGRGVVRPGQGRPTGADAGCRSVRGLLPGQGERVEVPRCVLAHYLQGAFGRPARRTRALGCGADGRHLLPVLTATGPHGRYHHRADSTAAGPHGITTAAMADLNAAPTSPTVRCRPSATMALPELTTWVTSAAQAEKAASSTT